ncbi:putative phage tail sheath protein [Bdellovibrio bacteriovorus W]|nr:putative phage tail sheath protein [Bdellovibrio bacteriovorus W]
MAWKSKFSETSSTALRSGAIYYPPFIKDTHLIETSGAIAGVFAEFEKSGFWKSPAGVNARLRGVDQLLTNLTPQQEELLTQEGINTLKIVSGRGLLVWGARTLAGDSHSADEYKYISVARTALALHKSIIASLAPALKNSTLTDSVQKIIGELIENFLYDLHLKKAFAGMTPQQSFFVKNEISLPDRKRGLLNLYLGFAPLRSQEFIVLPIQLKTKPSQ